MFEVYIPWIYSFLVLCTFYTLHQNLKINVTYSLNIQPCFLSDSSIIQSNWAYWPTAVILKTSNWKSGGERLGVIHVMHCIWSSNTAELAKLVCSYNMAVRPTAMLSAQTGYSTGHSAWCRKMSTTGTEWIHNGCPQQHWEKTVQGSGENEKPATYINKRGRSALY
jgi:hypothetical protein